MNKRIGRNDIIFISILFVFIFLFLVVFYSVYDKSGDYAIVTVDGQEYGRYSLGENKDIEIKNSSGKTTNILSIENGAADMIDADCPDKLCVNQKAISKEKETIVCLPNKVVVSIESNDSATLDAISN